MKKDTKKPCKLLGLLSENQFCGILPIANYHPIACEIYAFQNIVAILKHN